MLLREKKGNKGQLQGEYPYSLGER